MIRPDVAAWVAETRTRQGLEPVVTDPATLATLAALVVEAMAVSQQGGDGHGEAA